MKNSTEKERPGSLETDRPELVERQTQKRRHLTSLVLSTLIALGTAEQVLAQQKPGGPSSGGGPAIEKVADKELTDSLYRERRADYETLRRLVEKEKVGEKIEQLKRKFGGVINNFLEIHRIKRDLKILAELTKEEEKKSVFVSESFPQAMTLGSIISDAYRRRWKEPEWTKGQFSVEGFGAIINLSDAEVKSVVENKFPTQYLTGTLSGIKFDPRVKTEDKMMILGEVTELGIGRLARENDWRTPITIYNTPEELTMEKLVAVLGHELGHVNDWSNSLMLGSSERVELLSDVAERAGASDRFQSTYVETIAPDDLNRRYIGKLPAGTDQQQLLNYIRTTEYWAELTAEYFNHPAELKANHPNDFAMVEKWLSRINN